MIYEACSVKSAKIGTILSIVSLVFLALLFLATVPALATDFEIGTQFGVSRITSSDDSGSSITYARLPSGTVLDIGSAPTSLYATWFPSKQFAIGPEFSLGITSADEEDVTIFHLGGRASYFLHSHSVSSPYVLGRISRTTFSISDTEEAATVTSFGGGLGYQWRIGAAFVFRVEGQYQRLLLSDSDDDLNEFSLIFGIGTRFGNSEN